MYFTLRSFYGCGGFGGRIQNRWRSNVVQLLLPAPNVSDDDFDDSDDDVDMEVIKADSNDGILSSASETSEEIVESEESEITKSDQSDINIENNQSEEIKDNETEISDTDSDSDDDLPLAVIAIRQKKNITFEWPKKAKEWTRPANSDNIDEVPLCLNPNLVGRVAKNSSPKEFFSLYVTNEL